MPIPLINNAEVGLSVRNKLNSLIGAFNTLSSLNAYRTIRDISGNAFTHRQDLEFNAGFTVSDDASDGITNIDIDPNHFNHHWIPLTGTVASYDLTGKIKFTGSGTTTALWANSTMNVGYGSISGAGNLPSSSIRSRSEYSLTQNIAEFFNVAGGYSTVILSDNNVHLRANDGTISSQTTWEMTGGTSITTSLDTTFPGHQYEAATASYVASNGDNDTIFHRGYNDARYASISFVPTLAQVLATGRNVDATGTINDSASNLAIDVNNRTLKGGFTFSTSLNWDLNQLYNAGVTSVDWASHWLVNSSAATTLDWENLALSGNWTGVTQGVGDNSARLATTAHVFAGYLQLSGGTLIGNVNGVTPTELTYLSGATSNLQNQINNINSGLSWKVAARVMSSTNVTISAPGATVDGVTMASGDRVVLSGQSTGSQNGVYVWNGSAVAMTRSTDCSTGGAGSTGVLAMTIVIEEGTYADQVWILTNNAPITIGSTALTYAKSSATTYTGSGGITLTGNNFTLDNSYFSGAFTLSGGVATIGAGYVTNSMLAGSITAAKLVGTDIAAVGTITAGIWNGSLVTGTYGGTGVNNGSNTITIAGNLITTGAYNTTLAAQFTGTTTLPPVATTLVGKTGTMAANYIGYWNDANQLTSSSSFQWDNSNTRLTIGTGTLSLNGPVQISVSQNSGLYTVIQNPNVGTAAYAGSFYATTDSSHYTGFYRASTAYTGNLGGTSIAFADNSIFEASNNGSAATSPFSVRASIFYVIPGSTAANFGLRIGSAGARFDRIDNLHTAATAKVHLGAGTATASTAPLKFSSGTLLTTAEAGAVEFLTDAFYGTITTGAARKTFAFLESPTFTGAPLAPTASALTNNTQIATTNYVDASYRYIKMGMLTSTLSNGTGYVFGNCVSAVKTNFSLCGILMPYDGTITRIYMIAFTGSGGESGRTLTIYKNGVSTGTNTTSFTTLDKGKTDITGLSISVTKGDYIEFNFSTSGSGAATNIMLDGNIELLRT